MNINNEQILKQLGEYYSYRDVAFSKGVHRTIGEHAAEVIATIAIHQKIKNLGMVLEQHWVLCSIEGESGLLTCTDRSGRKLREIVFESVASDSYGIDFTVLNNVILLTSELETIGIQSS